MRWTAPFCTRRSDGYHRMPSPLASSTLAPTLLVLCILARRTLPGLALSARRLLELGLSVRMVALASTRSTWTSTTSLPRAFPSTRLSAHLRCLLLSIPILGRNRPPHRTNHRRGLRSSHPIHRINSCHIFPTAGVLLEEASLPVSFTSLIDSPASSRCLPSVMYLKFKIEYLSFQNHLYLSSINLTSFKF